MGASTDITKDSPSFAYQVAVEKNFSCRGEGAIKGKLMLSSFCKRLKRDFLTYIGNGSLLVCLKRESKTQNQRHNHATRLPTIPQLHKTTRSTQRQNSRRRMWHNNRRKKQMANPNTKRQQKSISNLASNPKNLHSLVKFPNFWLEI